jgi:hypothetical protein
VSNPLAGLQDGLLATGSGVSPNIPPPLSLIDYEAFRREIIGLGDPSARETTVGEKASVKDDAVRFCAILAHLFGDDLDRLTLWTRIGTAFETSLAKIGSDADLDRLADLCLGHVCAEFGKTAACDALTQLRMTWETRPAEWKHAFVAYISRHRYALLAFGRARWEAVKKGECQL